MSYQPSNSQPSLVGVPSSDSSTSSSVLVVTVFRVVVGLVFTFSEIAFAVQVAVKVTFDVLIVYEDETE